MKVGYSKDEIEGLVAYWYGDCKTLKTTRHPSESYLILEVLVPNIRGKEMEHLFITDLGTGGDIIDYETGEIIVYDDPTEDGPYGRII